MQKSNANGNNFFSFFSDLKDYFFFSFILHSVLLMVFIALPQKKSQIMTVPIELVSIVNTNNLSEEKIDIDNNIDKLSEKVEEPEKEKKEKIEKKNLTEVKKNISSKTEQKFITEKIEKEIDKIVLKENEEKKLKQSTSKTIINDDDDDFFTLSTYPIEQKIQTNVNAYSEKLSDEIDIEKTEIANLSSGIKFEKDFPFAYYGRLIRKKISENWKKPFVAGSSVKTIIYFQILKNGEIADAKIYEASRYPEFDKAALNAVLSSNPLPELPNEYNEDNLGVYFAFEFF
jgi:TonB family protein